MGVKIVSSDGHSKLKSVIILLAIALANLSSNAGFAMGVFT